MLLKNKINILFTGILFLVLSNFSFASDKIERVEKLAEYDFLENLADFMTSSHAVFQGKPIQLSLERDSSHNTKLSIKKLVNNYSDVKINKFDLNGIINENAEYELDVDKNNNYLYVLLTNSDDSIRDKKNILLRSTDGIDWELYKNFPAEWELFDLKVDGNNLSIACTNCEDELKISYIISNDNGTTWSKYSLSDNTDISLFSGMANDKLFVVAQSRNPDNRKETINQLQFKSLKDKNSVWNTADISSLISVSKQQNGKDQVFKFEDIEDLLFADKYLVALASYSTQPQDEDEEPETMNVNWISRDNGNTWELFNFKNLEDEELMQLDKHGDTFHLVTSKKIELPVLDDVEDGGLDLLGLFSQYINKQQYSYYSLSNDDMNRGENFLLEPKHKMEHGLGFNLDYQSSPMGDYVDTVFLHSENNELKLEFYRLLEK